MNLIALWRQLLKDEGISVKRRWLYTSLLLLSFRILAHIPIVNVDEERLHQVLANNPLVGVMDLFAGGEVLSKFSLVAAGILPYLVAKGLATAATFVIPKFKKLRQAGESGEKRLERYTTFLTIPIAFGFGWLLSHYLATQTGLFPGHIHWFTRASFWSSFWIVNWVAVGSLISTGISKLITIKGIGPGEDLVLLAGSSFAFAHEVGQIAGETTFITAVIAPLAIASAVALGVVVYMIYLLKAVRKIPVQYAKRIVSRPALSRSPASTSYIPLALSYGRTLPASAAVGFFVLLKLVWPRSSFFRVAADSSGWHWFAIASLILAFAYILNLSPLLPRAGEDSIADNLRKYGGFIPGVRPGLRTEQYLLRKMSLITLPAGLGLALLAAGLPYLILRLTGLNVIVAILAVMLVVERVDRLYSSFQSYAVQGSYRGFIAHR
ncbi:MAG: hypothetical protein JOZ32_11925 [Bryobacterales bacterium]|nr:hypothetical protein [Bryobacterales bacterium]